MTLRGDIARRLGELVPGENLAAEDHTVYPASAEQVAAVLALANAEKLRVAPAGNRSQYPAVAGSASPAASSVAPPIDLIVSLSRMGALEEYEPDDLTASMQAGITLETLNAALEPHRQWLPLGAPLPSRATIGGSVAANTSGPFRQFYGTARDMVIGLRFATVEGKLAKTGGMVVKNVAGYDMAKLLIGSMGTLGIITDVNVKVAPRPATETMLLGFDSLAAALECRNAIAKSVLTPLALDLFDRTALAYAVLAAVGDAAGLHAAYHAAQMNGSAGSPLQAPFVLAAEYGGVEAVIARNRKELGALAPAGAVLESTTLAGAEELAFWRGVCDLPARLAGTWPLGVRIKISTTLKDMRAVLENMPRENAGQSCLVARAGCGITYVYATGGELKTFCLATQKMAASAGVHAVIESAPPELRAQLDAWGPRRDDYPVMLKLKQAFDPNGILNPGRFLC